ncbi:hypothetical protein J4E86_007343 [Alternaria arbusti]|uniref:uncharacterized protein n=1 Tax=Alternaria arbusti TaxID=232088 RepID=UPI00221F26A3|nr:uncharacterized protein J4E86_007343 [Alternaria arbusti]KAI4950836.1 hypothetical protein J4E86_007343 [Alternaria arbusti]
MDPPESNKNMPAAETQEVAKTQKAWPLQHYWEGEITTGYTNSEKLRKLHQKLFPEFYKDENKRGDDHQWDPIEIKGERMLYSYQRRDGAARDLKKEFPEFEWPEGDVWGSGRREFVQEELLRTVLKEMRKAHRSYKDEAADAVSKAKEDSDGKGEEMEKLKGDA